jgi:hypothetical protein
LAERREHFPETEQTFVHDLIDAGRVPELASYLMEVYYEPLCIYCRATSYRTLGEPEEIVGGFFASRLSDPTWIARWRDESRARSLPLRRWLLNGLCFYMREEARRQRRARLLADAGVVLGPRAEVRVDADAPACDALRRLEMLSQEVYDRAAEGGGEVASPGEATAADDAASAPARRRGGPRLADAAVAAFDMFPELTALQIHACQLLCNLAKAPALRARMVGAGVVRVLKDVLTAGTLESPTPVERALELLQQAE